MKVKDIANLVHLTNRPRHCLWPRRRYLSSESPKPFDAIPGLNSLPIIGVLHHFLPLIGTVGIQKNFFDMFNVLHENFGPIVKLEGMFGRGTLVIFFQPEFYDQIYRAEETPAPVRIGFQALEYYRETLRKERFNGVYGLTTAQGEKWRDFRTKVNPALLKPKLIKLYSPGLEDIGKEVVSRLLKMKDSELSEEFDLEMTKFALESVALVALGTRINCLQDNLPEDHPAKQLMNCSREIPELAFKLEFMPFLNKPTSKNFKKALDVFETQWNVSQNYIEQARKDIQERGHDIPEEDQSVIEKLLAIDEKVAVMMANEMLFAGIDTVAFTTMGLLYHLATNPEVQEKVRQEIRTKPSSRYLKACLKESLRLMPVLPANLRQTTKEHVVGGYQIPKGVFAIAPNEILCKSEKFYPRAKEFIPERWIVEKSDSLYYGNTHPMVNLPFGFGVRSCIGRRIAELEIEIFMKKLLDEVKVEWAGPPIKVVIKMMNEFKKPYYFKLRTIK